MQHPTDNRPFARTWAEAPELAIPESPALAAVGGDVWLAYETTAEPRGQRYGVVRFVDAIDHRLWPINDEGLAQHPYWLAGLRFYAFNEIVHSPEALSWAALEARHWAVTFKDETLDVIARGAEVVVADVEAQSPLAALLPVLQRLT